MGRVHSDTHTCRHLNTHFTHSVFQWLMQTVMGADRGGEVSRIQHDKQNKAKTLMKDTIQTLCPLQPKPFEMSQLPAARSWSGVKGGGGACFDCFFTLNTKSANDLNVLQSSGLVNDIIHNGRWSKTGYDLWGAPANSGYVSIRTGP